MSNEELAQRAQAGDKAALTALWTNNEGFIHTQTAKYTAFLEAEDATQECYFALVEAVKRYDPAAGTFLNYFSYWIRAQLQRTISKNSNLSINKYDNVTRYRRAVATFEKENGRTPSDLEAAEMLNTTPEALEEIRRADIVENPESLESETADGLTLADKLQGCEDPEAETIENEFSAELRAVVWDTVDTLPEEEAETIRDRYREGHTLQETGEKQGKTIGQVSGTERKALRELRTGKRGRTLRGYYSEIYGDALRGEGSGAFNRTWTSSTEREGIRLYERTRPD